MTHPYQCLLYHHRPEEPNSQFLIGASGSYLHVFNVLTGQNLCSWSPSSGVVSSFQKSQPSPLDPTNHNLKDKTNDGAQPPSKRRKTSPGPAVSTESSSTEIVLEGGDSGKGFHSNPVIKLAATSDGHSVVAVTSEDKCLRVFELSEEGILNQISERIMPKRPCAIVVSPDDSTILCADKFGDVYALPLMGQPYEPQDVTDILEDGMAPKVINNGPQKFVPSATPLTVHTKRNLNALKQQQNSNYNKPEKKSLAFDHKLILGHVSLLTDIACTSAHFDSRNYILTADRDEHIRVSRGVPQTHIIEGYCLGHTEFVSKLCWIPSKPESLITGGGDDFLLLWDWLAGTIKQRVNLRSVVHDFKTLNSGEAALHTLAKNTRFAVSNIKYLELDGKQTGEKQTEIVITCEAIPAVFVFTLSTRGQIEFRETYPTEGNVIDVVALPDRSSVICSIDNIHKRFSTSGEDYPSTSRPLIDAIHFSKDAQHWERDLQLYDALLQTLKECAKIGPMMPQKNAAKGKSLKELLYGLESLRKHGTGADMETEPAVEDEDVA